MKTAFDKLTGGNVMQGLKTSQTVSTEQQAKPAAQINQETFNRQMHGQPTTPPKDEHEAAARLNQATANGLMNGTIKPAAPAINTAEKKDPTPTPAPKSYAEMFAELNKGMVESPEQQRNREKKERTDAIVRSVGDGLSAIARMYFATKGATTAHNPQNDLTATSNKRMEYLRQQRERNKDAWLTGYQRAMALDEEARKNDMTAAEAFRYHNMLQEMKQRNADQGDRRLDQGEKKLDQSHQRLDISKMKYQTDADWKEFLKKIKQAETDGRISHWQAQDAISQAREGRLSSKGNGSSSSRKGSYSGNVEDYITLKQNDPEGMAEAEREARKMGYSPKTAAGKAAARIIYKKRHGGGGGKLPNKPSSKPTQKKQTASKKKSTGVNWK